jgi:uncharacterized iron-regulated membrane protein
VGGRLTWPGGAAVSLRTVVFWAHLAVGVVAGVVVLIMSFTGVLLAYERQVMNWAARRHHVAAPAGADRLPLDTVLARAQAAVRDRQIVSLSLRADPTAPVAAGLENRQNLFVDPYTAVIVGTDSVPRAFFAGVQRWHRWLAIGSAPRSPVGKAITGACNLAFLFLILSGFYLWWPRQWSARAFRAVLIFNRGAKGKARDWNWHHVLGFWSAPVLLLIVASAVYISYAWPGELTQRLLSGDGGPLRQAEGHTPRSEQASGGRREGQRDGERRRVRPIIIQASLDGIMSATIHEVPGWQSVQIRLPRQSKQLVTVAVTTGNGARPDQRSQATFDASSGATVEWQTHARGDAFRRFRSWIRPVHTGEAAGLLGQTLAALVSAATVVLVWTGISLAWRRFRSSLNRRDANALGLRQAA